MTDVIEFCTNGLERFGQEEIVLIVELTEAMDKIPKEVLHCGSILQEFSITKVSGKLNFLGIKKMAGFIYFKPLDHCLKLIDVPKSKFLLGVAIQTDELKIARVFPYPHFSNVSRKSVRVREESVTKNALVSFFFFFL